MWLGLTARHGFLHPSWSDEIVYAVMARNIAEGRGLITNFYDSRALLQDGYPQGDVHMPGHPLFVSLFFRLLGHADWVTFVPAWTAFLASAAVVGLFATRLFGARAGWLASLLFSLMPGTAGYAHSCMAELTVVLTSAAFLATWWGCTTPRRGAFMAVALCAAVVCRETLLAFLLLAGEAVVRAPRDTRRRIAAAFLVVLGLGALFLLPLHLARARFPHVLFALPPIGTPEFQRAVLARIWDNLSLPFPGVRVEDRLAWLQLAITFGLPAATWALRAGPELKRLAGAALLLATAVLAGLVAFNPLDGWHMTRMLIFLAPWLAVLASGLFTGRGTPVPRALTGLVLVVALGASSLRGVRALADDRRGEQALNVQAARPFFRLTEGLPVETAIAWKSPWEIGWRRYPLTIIWNGPLDPTTVRSLNEVRRIDAVFGPAGPRFGALVEAAEAGQLGYAYKAVRRRPNADYRLLLRGGLEAREP